ncbi:hypothetical protein C8J57DRAFT_1497588 [Mycena rebaudengoi]|nr:hypothetical protein C8J57DRAFT_1497588 [Mycena rebaudengoi]
MSSPPAVWGGPRNSKIAPLYGLGWRTSYRKVLCKYEVEMLASIPMEVLGPRWAKYREQFRGKIIFDPRYIHDLSVADDDENDLLCFITFNTHAKNLATLASADGAPFLDAVKDVMKITEAEALTFQWYRCIRPDDLVDALSQFPLLRRVELLKAYKHITFSDRSSWETASNFKAVSRQSGCVAASADTHWLLTRIAQRLSTVEILKHYDEGSDWDGPTAKGGVWTWTMEALCHVDGSSSGPKLIGKAKLNPSLKSEDWD